MAVLLVVGVQVPLIPSLDVNGRVNVPPEQIGATWVNVGVVKAFTVTLIVVVFAHCPTVGVKV